jgi:hypothetical protein
VLYASYVIAVSRLQPVRAALLSSLIYGLLAYGIIQYSQNIAYLIPLSLGAFFGTYLVVRFRRK